MEQLSLNGKWSLYREGKGEEIPADVPGCVHTDLLAAGKIADPFYRDNEEKLFWIGETDWLYKREFEITEEIINMDRVLLHCEGVDTLAIIKVNGKETGKANNMYRSWEFNIKDLLQAGTNIIEVYFQAPMPYLREKEKEFYLPAWSVGDHRLNGGGWIRKQPSNFGWDWGPKLVTMGIWRDIKIIAYNTARIDNLHILQDHSEEGKVSLDVKATLEHIDEKEVLINYKLLFEGGVVASGKEKSDTGTADFSIKIDDPHLWWPNGLGDQPLYELQVELQDGSGEILDEDKKRIGLRTLKLITEDDKWGQSFKFAVNGIEFFAKGANWIPADTFVSRLTRSDYRRLLESAVAANMNMIRVWGGGIYEDDAFYEICDELGLCIWQDFMFACGTYPSFDEDFMENVKVEAEQNVKRIRHHASLALWCGNNEIEQGIAADKWDNEKVKMSWDDYKKLFNELLPRIVKELDPETPYWPGSPHSPIGDRENHYNPECGDVHIWDVWHGKKPFEYYRTSKHRFISEFGFQSFPEPVTVYEYTEEKDRNITSYVMEHHQRSGIGNTTIVHYMLDWFRLPTSFEGVLWASQILQGLGIKYAVEHWRRNIPRTMGTLYWQLNDCWPVASWASLDYYGRWKALHYMAKKFYAPLLISGVEDLEKGTVELHVTSDRLKAVSGEVKWKLLDLQGGIVESDKTKVKISPQTNNRIGILNLKKNIQEHGRRNLILWLELHVDGEVVSDNYVLFARPKHMELKEPDVSFELQKQGPGTYLIELTCKRPALWTWLELKEVETTYSDNFFHLIPGRPKSVIIKSSQEIEEEDIKSNLLTRTIRDLY